MSTRSMRYTVCVGGFKYSQRQTRVKLIIHSSTIATYKHPYYIFKVACINVSSALGKAKQWLVFKRSLGYRLPAACSSACVVMKVRLSSLIR